MKKVDISICIATWNKAHLLKNTLKSIRDQNPKVSYEIVVVDDGSFDDTKQVCQDFDVVYRYLDRPTLKGSAKARNLACETARGKVLLMQSDDVVHCTPEHCQSTAKFIYNKHGMALPEHIKNMKHGCLIDNLYDIPEKSVHFGTCLNVRFNAANPRRCKTLRWYTNWWRVKVPYFFIGSMHKDDFWAVGGNDERFQFPGFEDTYLGRILAAVYDKPHGGGLFWRDDVLGYHQNHRKRISGEGNSRRLFKKLMEKEFPERVKYLKNKIYGED